MCVKTDFKNKTFNCLIKHPFIPQSRTELMHGTQDAELRGYSSRAAAADCKRQQEQETATAGNSSPATAPQSTDHLPSNQFVGDSD